MRFQLGLRNEWTVLFENFNLSSENIFKIYIVSLYLARIVNIHCLPSTIKLFLYTNYCVARNESRQSSDIGFHCETPTAINRHCYTFLIIIVVMVVSFCRRYGVTIFGKGSHLTSPSNHRRFFRNFETISHSVQVRRRPLLTEQERDFCETSSVFAFFRWALRFRRMLRLCRKLYCISHFVLGTIFDNCCEGRQD